MNKGSLYLSRLLGLLVGLFIFPYVFLVYKSLIKEAWRDWKAEFWRED